MSPEVATLLLGAVVAAVVFAIAAAVGGSIWNQYLKGRDAAIQDAMAPKLKIIYDRLDTNRMNIESLSEKFHELKGGVDPLTREIEEMKNAMGKLSEHVDKRFDVFEERVIKLFKTLKGGSDD